MKLESLHTLVIDHHFGELTPEASELLELYLAKDTAARAEAVNVLTSLEATREAVVRHPDLGQVSSAPAPVRRDQPSLFAQSRFAKAAALILFGLLIGGGGFMAGRMELNHTVHSSPGSGRAESAVADSGPRKTSPWAQYRMTFDPVGEGVRVVRVDLNHLERDARP